MMTNKEWAFYYARLGLAVIPVPKGEKRPVLPGWPDLATTDPDKISLFWEKDPDQNIGFVSGEKSHGIFAIDLDVDEDTGEDGLGVLRRWERDNGHLPETWRVITPRGGAHLYFQSDKQIENDRKTLHEAVEIRAHGLNTILPPSLHPNGRRYEWEAGYGPFEIGIAKADDIVLDFVGYQRERERKTDRLKLPDKIPEGGRNNILFRAACSMQATGFPDEVIASAILKLNEISCVPPLSEKEVGALVGSALKYEKGGKITCWMKSEERMEQEMFRNLQRKMKLIH